MLSFSVIIIFFLFGWIHQASLKILKVEEKLSKGWGGENAYHVSGYRYLIVDGDRNISRASPATKVTTLTKVCIGMWLCSDFLYEFFLINVILVL